MKKHAPGRCCCCSNFFEIFPQDFDTENKNDPFTEIAGLIPGWEVTSGSVDLTGDRFTGNCDITRWHSTEERTAIEISSDFELRNPNWWSIDGSSHTSTTARYQLNLLSPFSTGPISGPVYQLSITAEPEIVGGVLVDERCEVRERYFHYDNGVLIVDQETVTDLPVPQTFSGNIKCRIYRNNTGDFEWFYEIYKDGILQVTNLSPIPFRRTDEEGDTTCGVQTILEIANGKLTIPPSAVLSGGQGIGWADNYASVLSP